MEITGIIYRILETVQVSDRFKKREFVIEHAENPAYPQFICLTLVQDRTDLINNFKEGDAIKVEFSIKGREWTSPEGKTSFFNTIEAWKIQAIEQNESNTTSYASAPDMAIPNQVDNDDDLPF